MKLEDIKATIDSYFDNISEQEFFDLLTNKYHMPLIYDIEIIPLKSDMGYENVMDILDSMVYKPIQTKDMFIHEIVNIVPTHNTYEFICSESCVSNSLSFAA